MESQKNLSPPFYRKTSRKHSSCLKFSFQIHAKPAVAFAIVHLLLLHLIMIEFVTVNALCGDNLFSCLLFQQAPDLKCSDPNADQICSGQCGGGGGEVPPSPESLLPQVPSAHCCRIDGQCCCNALYFDDGTGDGDGRPPEDDAGAESSLVADDKNKLLMDFNEQYFIEDTNDDGDDDTGNGGYTTVDHRVGG